jgi:hypothetical protein
MDSFARLDAVTERTATDPWDGVSFRADYDRLRALVAVCATGAGTWNTTSAPGLGMALDLWTADELRRAGYEPDAVWPRAAPPRVLPAAVARALGRLSATARQSPAALAIAQTAGTSSPVIQGEFFPKNVDVLVADWDRGVELMVSTKSMTGSFNNNLNNRWEEFVGDVRNIRGRFPLATLGVLFLADASMLTSTAFPRLLDMLRKLRAPSTTGSAYDGTALVIARATAAGAADLLLDDVPADLRPDPFFATLLSVVFERLPVSERRAARNLYHRAQLPTAETTADG